MDAYDIALFYASLATTCVALVIYFIFTSSAFKGDGVSRGIQFGYMTLYFAIAPCLHWVNNYFITDVSYNDAKFSLVYLNLINSLGLFFALIAFVNSGSSANQSIVVSNLPWRMISKVSGLVAALGVIVWAVVILVFRESVLIGGSDSQLPKGMIAVFIIIESVPMLLAWYYFSKIKLKKRKPGYFEFWVVFVFFTFIAVAFSGIRGSRVSIIFQVIIFLLLYGYMVRPVSWRQLLAVSIIGAILVNFYGVYKYGGVEAVAAYVETGEKPRAQNKEYPLLSFMLHDLGRSDVQALIAERLVYDEYKPPYFPHTYLYGLGILLPDAWMPDSLSSKTELGTEAQYGYERSEDYFSTRIYGLSAEAGLNFGLLGIPFAFFAFGVIHRKSVKMVVKLKKTGNFLFYPLFLVLPVYVLFYDFDNLIFQLIKVWLVPAVVFFFAKKMSSTANE